MLTSGIARPGGSNIGDLTAPVVLAIVVAHLPPKPRGALSGGSKVGAGGRLGGRGAGAAVQMLVTVPALCGGAGAVTSEVRREATTWGRGWGRGGGTGWSSVGINSIFVLSS